MKMEICDYVEDQVVNGVLCYAKDGKWIEYTKEELTRLLQLEQDSFNSYIDSVIDGDGQ